MKQVRIELNIDPEMFAATQQFMAEKGLEIGTELSNSVAKLYKKYVPSDVRKYIGGRQPTTSSPRVEKRAEGVSEAPERGMETPFSNPESVNSHEASSE